MMAWGYKDFTLLAVHKVASSTITKEMEARGIQSLPRKAWTARSKPAILVIRHPLDRIASAWRFFRERQPVRFPARVPARCTFVEFCKLIADGVSDQHWNPQVNEARGFTDAIPVERLAEFWRATIGGDIARLNATSSEHPGIDDLLVGWAVVASRYEGDADAYAAAHAGYDELLASVAGR